MNTHPFGRVVHGRRLAFVHNGALSGLEDRDDTRELVHETIGDTDSELAFLILLSQLQKTGGDVPLFRFETFLGFAANMRELGGANFLFFDGEYLFVRTDRRRFDTEDYGKGLSW